MYRQKVRLNSLTGWLFSPSSVKLFHFLLSNTRSSKKYKSTKTCTFGLLVLSSGTDIIFLTFWPQKFIKNRYVSFLLSCGDLNFRIHIHLSQSSLLLWIIINLITNWLPLFPWSLFIALKESLAFQFILLSLKYINNICAHINICYIFIYICINL